MPAPDQLNFIDIEGANHEVTLDVTMYREAADAGMTLPQYLANRFPTNAKKDGTPFEQFCAQLGVVLTPNRELGMRASTISEILDGPNVKVEGASITREAIPASRILYPAITLQAVEDKLLANMSETARALDELVAIEETINGEKYEWPVLNFSQAEQGRSRATAQLAPPPSMLLITASDKSLTIPSWSVGLEISDQAARAFPLDFVAMALARKVMVEENERAQAYMLAALQGDVDTGDASLASLGAGYTVAASTLDSASTGGAITQTAWVKFMTRKSTQRRISHLVTDIDSALAIEKRTGRPTVQTDNAKSPRIDTDMVIMNPQWPSQVRLFLTQDPNWPAGTIMGLDNRFALRRVQSLTVKYEAIEAFVIRRSKQMRFDKGEHITRLFNDAFDVLTRT